VEDDGITIEQAAIVINETLRGWRLAIGDEEIATWPEADEAQREIHRASIEWYLDSPMSSPRAFHDQWVGWMVLNGWTYGPQRCTEKRRHPLIRPWAELSRLQQTKTHLCVAVMMVIAPMIERGDSGCGWRCEAQPTTGQAFRSAHIGTMNVFQTL